MTEKIKLKVATPQKVKLKKGEFEPPPPHPLPILDGGVRSEPDQCLCRILLAPFWSFVKRSIAVVILTVEELLPSRPEAPCHLDLLRTRAVQGSLVLQGEPGRAPELPLPLGQELYDLNIATICRQV